MIDAVRAARPRMPTAIALAAVVVVVVAATSTLPSCRRDRASTGAADNPFVLVVSSSHATLDAAEKLETALSERAGMTVRVRVAPSGADAVSTAGMQTVDAGLLPLFEYLLARQEYDVHARLQVVRDSSRVYQGVIVVREDSSFRTLEDLNGRNVAFVDRASTTGYLLPRRALMDAKVDVEATLAGSHDAALAAVREGRADAAATFAARREGLRVLADTGSVPNEPVFFSDKTPREVRDRFVGALVALSEASEGRELLESIGGITGFTAVTDEEYRHVHDLLRQADTDLADLVPGGRHLVEWNNVPLSDLGPL